MIRLMLPVLVSIIASFGTYASDNALSVLPQVPRYEMGRYLSVLQDSSGSMDLADVLSLSSTEDFQPSGSRIPNLGYSSSTWWVRFTLENTGDTGITRFLDFNYPNVNHITFFYPMGDSGWDSCMTGDLHDFSSRQVRHSSFVFELNLPPHSTVTYFLKLRTDSSLPLPLFLWSEDGFLSHQTRTMMLTGIFLGIMLLMLAFGLFLLPSLHDRADLCYMLLILLMTLFQLSYSGTGAMFIWPGVPELNPLLTILTMNLAGIVSLRFAMVFMKTRRTLPVVHRIMNIDIAAFSVITVIYLLFGYAAAIRPTIYAVLITALLYVITGVLKLRKDRKQAVYFLSAWLIFFAGAVISLSVRLGIVPVTDFTEHAYLLGIVLFVFMLAHANSRRIRILDRLEREARQDASHAMEERDRLVRTQNEILARRIEERTQELTRVNEDLRAREEELRLILDNSPIGVCMNDLEGVYMSVNRAFCNMLGYSETELLGLSFTEITHGDYLDENLRLFHKLASGEIEQYDFEKKNVRSDGTEVDIVLRAQLVRDSSGDPSFVIGVIEDVSGEKRALRKLRHSEEQYRSIFNAAADSFLVFDTQGNIVEANPGACRTYGYSREELIGLHGRDIVSWEYYFLFEEFLASASKGEVFTAESMGVRKDGTRIRIRVKGSTFTYRGEQHLLAVIRDITEETRLREQLERAEKMEALGSLAGGVAHDLNNILSGIVSYPDLMLMKLPDDSPIRKDLMAIRESGRKAAAVVQDLLTMARREVSRMEVLSPGKVLDDFLESIEFRNLRSSHPHVEVSFNRERQLGHIRGSAVHIEKAMMNLIMNAFEAMPQGGSLTIGASREKLEKARDGFQNIPRGDYFKLSISDTGIGIPPDEIGKVFEPFFSSKKIGRSGTGLGMTVVWGTMRDHGGFIDIKSQQGAGTRIDLYFPITKAAPAEDLEDTPISQRMGTGERVMIVDDSQEQLDISSSILQALGYDTVTVSSGEEALDYLGREEVDLVVLDMVMDPGLDGLETYRRALELRPGQKALIVTGYAETDRVREALELGAGQCISKPYSLARLATAVREELDREA